MNDEIFMRAAIELAASAAKEGEVPVGAVVVRDGKIIAQGRNMRETAKLATAHAEIIALENACRALGGWRLFGCTLYVTLEPCPMCAGALINSRVGRVVFGAYDPKAGCLGSMLNLAEYPFNHKFEITCGVLAEECAALLSDFFRKKRVKKEHKTDNGII